MDSFGIFILAIFIGIFAFMQIISSVNEQKGFNEEILHADGQIVGQALVIYQPSISAVSSQMAHQIAQGLSDSGYEVTLNYPGDELSYKISDYQIVVFGAPVYGGQTSEALTNYISSLKDFSSAKTALYLTGSGPYSPEEFEAMKNAMGGATSIKTIKFDTNMKGENDEIANDFGAELAK
jgi:flavorubredoxin